MQNVIILAASLGSLGLVCAIFYCNIIARPNSWLGSEMLAMILLSLLVEVYPVGLFGPVVGLWNVGTAGLSAASVVSAGADILGLCAAVATAVVFRSLVKATNRKERGPGNITPLSPRPPSRQSTPTDFKMAA